MCGKQCFKDFSLEKQTIFFGTVASNVESHSPRESHVPPFCEVRLEMGGDFAFKEACGLVRPVSLARVSFPHFSGTFLPKEGDSVIPLMCLTSKNRSGPLVTPGRRQS